MKKGEINTGCRSSKVTKTPSPHLTTACTSNTATPYRSPELWLQAFWTIPPHKMSLDKSAGTIHSFFLFFLVGSLHIFTVYCLIYPLAVVIRELPLWGLIEEVLSYLRWVAYIFHLICHLIKLASFNSTWWNRVMCDGTWDSCWGAGYENRGSRQN